MTETQPESELKTIRAVERAVDVLTSFTHEQPTLSVTDLERRLGLSRPTLYRLLHTLESKGLVRSFGEPKRFELDFPVVELANTWLSKVDAAQVGLPVLKGLRESTDETVALFVPASGDRKICVHELQSRQALVFTRGAGFSEPMTVGSSGKAILAFMPAGAVESVLTGIDDARLHDALRAELAGIRHDGFSVSTGEIIHGAIAIAAPLFGHDGAVAGSVCLFGPEARLTGVHRERCLEQVRQAAAQISRALGYRGAAGRTVQAAE